MQTQTTRPEIQTGEGERLFIESRQTYGGGTVLTTAFFEAGTAFLEQYTFSNGSRVLLPLTSAEAIGHLEQFLMRAYAHVRSHQKKA